MGTKTSFQEPFRSPCNHLLSLVQFGTLLNLGMNMKNDGEALLLFQYGYSILIKGVESYFSYQFIILLLQMFSFGEASNENGLNESQFTKITLVSKKEQDLLSIGSKIQKHTNICRNHYQKHQKLDGIRTIRNYMKSKILFINTRKKIQAQLLIVGYFFSPQKGFQGQFKRII